MYQTGVVRYRPKLEALADVGGEEMRERCAKHGRSACNNSERMGRR
jgi:hypothetical protein